MAAGCQPLSTDRKRRLSDLVSSWWELHGKALSSGLDTKNRLLAMVSVMGDPLVSEFGPLHWSRYRQARTGQVKAGTLNRELCSLRAMFSELERAGEWNGANPLVRVRVLNVPQTDLRALSADEWERVFAECKQSRNPHLWRLALVGYCTGARWGELEALTGADVMDSAIRIRGESAKNGKVRTVPVDPSIVAMLREVSGGGRGPLFGGCYGAFRSAVKRAAVSLPSGQLCHVLRHTFASGFLARGGSLTVLRDLLGHSSIAVTSRYLHMVPGHCQRSALPEVVDTWLTPETKKA
jgi:integrase